MGLFADRLIVSTPKHDVTVPYSAIRAIAILGDLPKDAKGRVLLYMHLDRHVHSLGLGFRYMVKDLGFRALHPNIICTRVICSLFLTL